MSPRAGSAGHSTLAFVESPVQLLNVLEWAHAHALRTTGSGTPGRTSAIPAQGRRRLGGIPALGGGRSGAGRGAADGPGSDGLADGRSAVLGVGSDGLADGRSAVLGVGSDGTADARSAALGVGSDGTAEGGSGTARRTADGGGSAGSGAVGLGSAGSGTAGSGTAAYGAAGAGAADLGSAGSGAVGLGSAGSGTAGSGTAASGTAGSGAADLGSGGSGAAASGAAGAGAAGSGTVGSGTEGRAALEGLTLVVLSPTDPMTRGQLRRMAELARDEGYEVRWEEARGGPLAPFQTIGSLTPLLRRAGRVVMGDPFSRYVQLLLTITRARELVVVDDGTATMEFVAQLARGERLVRWHRKGGRRGPRDLLFAPVSSSARRRLTPSARRTVEVFSSMPIDEAPAGVTVTANDFSWTRARFGPPRLTKGADLVGTSLVETGVVDGERYLEAVRALAAAHGATRYFAHRRERTEKLHRLAAEVGLEVVRPDLPLELIARRGPIGRTILSFPSTVVHTLPLALVGTEVRVAVCDIDPAWLTDHASPRAQGFLSGVTGTARDVDRLPSVAAEQDVAAGQDLAAG